MPEATALTIHRLDGSRADEVARWDAFVTACAEATFFHRAGWERITREVLRHDTHFLYAESDGRIRGVLPLARVHSRLFGHSLCSLPFSAYGGVAAIDEEARAALIAFMSRKKT